MADIVVVGNGTAAHRFVQRLTESGHSGTITVIGDEPEPAYDRALLGAVLTGSLRPESIRLPAYDSGVRVVLGIPATELDRRRRLVRAGDDVFRYDRLVLATGSRPRIPSDSPTGAAVLHRVTDCAITGEHVTVAGDGALAVEAAAALATAGRTVTLAHRRPALLAQRLGGTGARLLARALERAGVRLRQGRPAPEDRAVLVCAGVSPAIGLAGRAGLAVGTGIVVDDRLRTTDPAIHAIGGCAETGGCVESGAVAAWRQADTLARLFTGADVRYRGTRPIVRLRAAGVDACWFGHSPDPSNAREVSLTDLARERHARLLLDGERVVAGAMIGLPAGTAAVSQLYDRDAPLPADWVGALLGTTAWPPPATSPVAGPLVCHCNHVSRRAVADAWSAGARTRTAVVTATRATTGCGGCGPEVARLVAALAEGGDP